MKKGLSILLLLLCILSISGCYKKDEVEVPSVIVKENSPLGGVYADGNKLIEIPMGTYYAQDQVEFIRISIPENYNINAFSCDSKGGYHEFKSADGHTTVKEAVDNGLLNTKEKIQNALVLNSEGTIEYIDIELLAKGQKEFKTIDEVKETINEYEIIKNDKKEILYYFDEESDICPVLVIYYPVEDDIILKVNYAGPIYDSIGLEKLAKNICELIEII